MERGEKPFDPFMYQNDDYVNDDNSDDVFDKFGQFKAQALNWILIVKQTELIGYELYAFKWRRVKKRTIHYFINII